MIPFNKSLAVREVDGNPTVPDARTLVFPNGTLTDNGGGSVTFTPASAVSSVFGRTGAVVADSADYAAFYPRLVAANTFTGGTQTVETGGAGTVGLAVRAAAAQTANLQEWRDGAGTAVAFIAANGYFTTRKNGAPADAEITAGECAYWFDATNGAAKFMVKGKTLDGTVVTGGVALA